MTGRHGRQYVLNIHKRSKRNLEHPDFRRCAFMMPLFRKELIMKSAVSGFCVVIMTAIILIGMAELHYSSQTRREVSQAVNYACMAAQEEAMCNPDAYSEADLYSQLFQKELKRCLPSGRNRFYTLRVYEADPERFLLDVELIAQWKNAGGKIKKVRERRTMIGEPETDEDIDNKNEDALSEVREK